MCSTEHMSIMILHPDGHQPGVLLDWCWRQGARAVLAQCQDSAPHRRRLQLGFIPTSSPRRAMGAANPAHPARTRAPTASKPASTPRLWHSSSHRLASDYLAFCVHCRSLAAAGSHAKAYVLQAAAVGSRRSRAWQICPHLLLPSFAIDVSVRGPHERTPHPEA